ncbi:MarR family winged helix-turn-helix transcriptional regulator [Cytobacillus firmus]|uniref:MarR family winged helix-turn-helix transcriptional regulator n=1 Tax=Cytobacillus firmus TaxID=1399 RepID=UPI0018CF8356|nr:MarR family transcriptional regulator [Cytobacillus firmus]MBG9587274.1 hypothetical protein [Cytobacillus firmus]
MKSSEQNLPEQFRYTILAAQRQGNRILQQKFGEIGLTTSQAEVISVLNEWSPISLKQLGNLLICETGSPSRLVKRLVDEELIQSVKNPNDSRYVLLELTLDGKEKAKKLQKIEQKFYQELEQLFTNEELENVVDLMSRLIGQYPIYKSLQFRGILESKVLNSYIKKNNS